MLFKTAYDKLNAAQRQAVDTIEGPVMVLAGPGTGKTQVLALRIANILEQTDTPPQSILALTFTESAAATMRQRLVSLIGAAGYYVQITTFHAFCSSVIQHHPEYFPIERGSQPLTEVDKFHVFETIINSLQLEALKPLNKPLFYIRELIKGISDLKREGVTPTQFEQIVSKEANLLESDQEELSKAERAKQLKKVAKWQELVQVYREYQLQLGLLHRYDFDDMIMLVKTAFEAQPDLLVEYQEQLHYFLVDEYQDTNSAQNQVVSLLASFWGEQANLFVVGDPHQAIYRFQGASVENVLNFKQQYPQATVVHLDTGYRCPQQVYDVAHHLIRHNVVEAAVEETLASDSVKLTSAQASEPDLVPVTLTVAPNQVVELTQVVAGIKSLLQKGTSPSQIAVLFRHNRDAQPIQELLTAEQIPFQLAIGRNALDCLIIQQLMQLLETLAELRQGTVPDQFYEVLQLSWFNLPAELPMKLAWLAHASRKSIWQLLSEGWEAVEPLAKQHTLNEAGFAAAVQVQQLLLSWVKLDANQVLPFTLETIFTQSGLLAFVRQQPNQLELLQQLTVLFDYAQHAATGNRDFKVTDLVAQLALMRQHQLTLPLAELTATSDAVTLSTAHKAKGQEWDYVFVVHLYDGKWGNAKQRQLLPLPAGILQQAVGELEQENHDDRRLLYVALTRASKQIWVSYPTQLHQGARQQQVVPSLFIHEVKSGSYSLPLAEQSADLTDQELADSIVSKLQLPSTPSSEGQRTFIESLVASMKLSVTALNLYLQDPELFLEQMVLRVPRAKAEPLIFGTAMHSALEHMGKSAMQHGKLPPVESIVRRFQTALHQELLSEGELVRRSKHGSQLLEQYYQYLETEAAFDPKQVLFVERFFGSGAHTVYLDDIALIGRIDRVDWLDQASNTVMVVDYKTGKPKSANEIQGALASQQLSERELALPLSIRGPLKRQLLFYKLLAELDPSFKPKVSTGVFSFLEPSPSGKVVERRFELLDEEVEELKVLIKEVVAEIRSLSFIQ